MNRICSVALWGIALGWWLFPGLESWDSGALLGAEPAVNLRRAEAEQAARAVRILDRWNAEQPERQKRLLQIVCWTPEDRELPAGYAERLDGILKHIQRFYRTEMERNGFGSKSIQLDLDERGKVVIHVVRGRHPEAHYGKPSGSEIRNECRPLLAEKGIDADRETIVIFCNLADWDPEQLTFQHKSPYYAGGTQKSGTAWQLDSPELEIANLSRKAPMIRDGEYGRISLGKHNSIFIGGIAHELGHALGLPHCAPRPDEELLGTPLMGSGNRTYGDELRGEGKGTVLSFAHALRLASHPQFSGSVKQLERTGKAEVTDLNIEAEDKTMRVSGRVQGDPPVYGVVAYFDPEGNGDYNSTTATAVPDATGRFSLATEALTAGKKGELRLVPLHANGSISESAVREQLQFSYFVDEQGRPNIEKIRLRLELTPLAAAINRSDRKAATRLAEKIHSQAGQRIADRLLHPSTPKKSPAEIPPAETAIGLTDCLPSSEKVGWLRPTYDRVPSASVLLEAGGEIFERGIYAHAPARHVYQLGGEWKSFQVQVGLAKGNRGTVQFEIRGDGQTLAKSAVVKSQDLARLQADVSGVRELELLTSPTDDGAGSDWGLWLEPTLTRDAR